MTNKYPQMASKAWKLEEREGRGCCLVANKSLLPGLEKISCRQQCQQLFANSKVIFVLLTEQLLVHKKVTFIP